MFNRRILPVLAALLMLAALVTGIGTAQAAGSVEVAVEADPGALSTGGTVELRINIRNGQSSAMEEVALIGPNINESLEPLMAGESKDIVIPSYTVPDSSIGQRLTFKVQYTTDGKRYEASGSVTIARLNVTPNVALERTVNVTVQDVGKKVKFSYTVYNKGSAPISNVTIRDTFTDKALNTPFTLNPGKNKKISYEHVMKGTVASRPSVSYSTGGRSYVETIDVLYVAVTGEALLLDVNASETEVVAGSKITITCRVTNGLNQTIRNIVLKDEKGTALEDAFDLSRGQSRLVTTTVQLDAARAYAITATGTTRDGTAVRVTSAPVELKPAGTQEELLTIAVEPDLTQLEEPGKVRFDVTISNKMKSTLQDVVVSESTYGPIATFDAFPTGDKLVTQDFDVTGDQTFVFTVTAKDEAGNEYNVQSDSVSITVGAQTPTPTPAEAAGGGGLDTLLVIGIIILALIVLVAIALVVLSMKERKARRLESAAGKTAAGKTAAGRTDTEPEKEDGKPRFATFTIEEEEESVLPPDIEEPEPEPGQAPAIREEPPTTQYEPSDPDKTEQD
jgi:uncharacterized repeat protein (TIGR01451 family)